MNFIINLLLNQCNTLRCDGDQEACDFPSAKNDRWMNGNCTGVSSGPSQLYGCEAPKGEKIDIGGSTHRELRLWKARSDKKGQVGKFSYCCCSADL